MKDEETDPRETPEHPRRRVRLFGQYRAEGLLLRQLKSGRMHHGWLLSGPRGIGKATLAYRLARFVLHHASLSDASSLCALDIPLDAPVTHRVAAGAHPDLLVVERRFDFKTSRIKSEIGVDEVRRAGAFFSHTAAAGGWRVCIVDAADDLNSESANALLKTLEEPPHRSLVVLIAHQSRQLLPTIRSRCIEIAMPPLSVADTSAVLRELRPDEGGVEDAAKLSNGSPGRALEILGSAGAKAFATLATRMRRAATVELDTKMSIADTFQGRGNAEDFTIFCELIVGFAGEQARTAAFAGKGPQWAIAHDAVAHSIRLTNALNLDRRQAVIEILAALEDAAKAA